MERDDLDSRGQKKTGQAIQGLQDEGDGTGEEEFCTAFKLALDRFELARCVSWYSAQTFLRLGLLFYGRFGIPEMVSDAKMAGKFEMQWLAPSGFGCQPCVHYPRGE